MKYDGIIVLGYELDNGKLHDMAKKRIDKFVKIYNKKKSKVIFTGGYSIKIKKGIGSTEASLMKKYAVKQGIKEEDIILEEDSRDTHANAYFTKKIVGKLGWKNILIITTDINIYKSRYFFEFVYGAKYHFDFIGIKKDVSEKERQYLIKYDKKSVNFMKGMYKRENIKRGEDKKIKILIDKFYADKDNGWNPKKVIKVKE
jgi:uncharacterized SAM-binding protein YcdF (DUF218 family)